MEDKFKVYIYQEFLDSPDPDAAQRPQRWLPWTLDLSTFSLEFDDYQVPLDKMVDSALSKRPGRSSTRNVSSAN